jgi:hypothetical protein
MPRESARPRLRTPRTLTLGPLRPRDQQKYRARVGTEPLLRPAHDSWSSRSSGSLRPARRRMGSREDLAMGGVRPEADPLEPQGASGGQAIERLCRPRHGSQRSLTSSPAPARSLNSTHVMAGTKSCPLVGLASEVNVRPRPSSNLTVTRLNGWSHDSTSPSTRMTGKPHVAARPLGGGPVTREPGKQEWLYRSPERRGRECPGGQ